MRTVASGKSKVGVGVIVGVALGVGVSVSVGVIVMVGVSVSVAVAVDVGVEDDVGVEVGVGVGEARMPLTVLQPVSSIKPIPHSTTRSLRETLGLPSASRSSNASWNIGGIVGDEQALDQWFIWPVNFSPPPCSAHLVDGRRSAACRATAGTLPPG